MKYSAVILALTLLLTGCEPNDNVHRIDGSTTMTADSSIEVMRDSLEGDERTAFLQGIELIQRDVGRELREDMESGELPEYEEGQQRLLERVDGKTADEIIEEGERLKPIYEPDADDTE